MSRKQVRISISGKVQGVGFRYSLKQVASKLALSGWIRNCRDGRVEALLQGDEEDLKQVVKWCGRGPLYARVEDVRVLWEDSFELLHFLQIRR